MAFTNNVHKLNVSTYNCKHLYDVGPKYDFINNIQFFHAGVFVDDEERLFSHLT